MLRITRQKKAHATRRRPATGGSHGFWQDLFAHQLPRTHLLAAAGVALALIITMAALPSKNAEAKRNTTDITHIQAITETEFTLQEHQFPATESMANSIAQNKASHGSIATTVTTDGTLNWQDVTVKSGDSLSTLFSRASLDAQDVHKFVSSNADTKQLKKVMPGESLSFGVDGSGTLKKMLYRKSRLESWEFEHADKGYTSKHVLLEPQLVPTYKEAVINDSLFVAADRVEMPQNLIMELANIFGWDIDFALDIRKGDSFSVVYEEKFLDGENIGTGKILAAEFTNQGKSYRAVRYEDESGDANYYTPEGLSMRKAFLRAPLDFMYVSSSFKPKRFHPILKRWKAHRGIDYRARTGTPIRAAGDGTAIASTTNKYNGKYVFIQHGNGIVTKYLHMSRRAVSRGNKVKQGQVIGYVGSTGLAEAPHLHYEFVVNGVHRNPRTVKLPEAQPIEKAKKARFLAKIEPLLATLDQYRQQGLLARSETESIGDEG